MKKIHLKHKGKTTTIDLDHERIKASKNPSRHKPKWVKFQGKLIDLNEGFDTRNASSEVGRKDNRLHFFGERPGDHPEEVRDVPTGASPAQAQQGDSD